MFRGHNCDEGTVKQMIEVMKDLREMIKDNPEFEKAYFGENYYVKERL